MEAQHREEIARRLRELRDASEETNRSIADYAGVGERTVAGWLSPTNPAGISYKNAKKVAELFGADIDWLWRGRGKGETPDLFGIDLDGPAWAEAISEQLAQIEEKLDALLADALGQAFEQASRPPEEESPPAPRRAANDS